MAQGVEEDQKKVVEVAEAQASGKESSWTRTTHECNFELTKIIKKNIFFIKSIAKNRRL